MISNFRDFAKSPWAIGLLGLIIISFMVVGTQADIFGSLGPRNVVTAGDRSVSQQEFRADFDKVRENYQQQTGSPVTVEDLVGCTLNAEWRIEVGVRQAGVGRGWPPVSQRIRDRVALDAGERRDVCAVGTVDEAGGAEALCLCTSAVKAHRGTAAIVRPDNTAFCDQSSHML